MAATTSGWQWPVEVTAMPAEKSKNSLPSTSVTTTPRPLLATSGYERVYDGEMYFSSPARMRLAFGPGSAVLIFGPANVSVVMRSSRNQSLLFRHSRWAKMWRNMALAKPQNQRRIQELVATKKIGAQTRREHRPITPRANQRAQPASRQMRIGRLKAHEQTLVSL